MTYSALAVTAVVGVLVLDLAVLRTRMVTRRVFWVAYAIVIAFQLLVNGILTGQRLVVYSPHAIIGGSSVFFLGDGRIVYAPVEDLLFGFSLVLQTLSWWTWWGRRMAKGSASSRAAPRRSGHS